MSKSGLPEILKGWVKKMKAQVELEPFGPALISPRAIQVRVRLRLARFILTVIAPPPAPSPQLVDASLAIATRSEADHSRSDGGMVDSTEKNQHGSSSQLGLILRRRDPPRTATQSQRPRAAHPNAGHLHG